MWGGWDQNEQRIDSPENDTWSITRSSALNITDCCNRVGSAAAPSTTALVNKSLLWARARRDGFSPWGEWDRPQTWSREFGFGGMLRVDLLFLTVWHGQLWRFRHLIGMPGEWNSQYSTSSWEEIVGLSHLALAYMWNFGARMCRSGLWRLE